MSSPDGVRLLERLLEDPGFRARFRHDPAAAARDAGFGELADQIAGQDTAQPLEPLDARESRSSAAGVMLAAAVEGLGLFELSEHFLGAEDALAADRLPAARAASAAPPVDPDDLTELDDGGDAPDVEVPDEPDTEVPDEPDTEVPDEPDTEAPDEPDTEAPDEPDTDDPDEPDPDAPENPDGDDVETDGPDEEEPDEEEPDEEEPDEEEPDEEEPDEEEPDEEEPDEEEPDEEEPDEEEPDDAEDSDDDTGDSDDSDDTDDTSNSDDTDDSDDTSNSDDTGDSGGESDDDGIEPLPAPDGYPGDDAPPAKISAWMGHEAQKRGLPAELPVMASLVESGMKNLPGGDADSVGFFQMRVGIWNTGDYAGYPERPELQLDWFLDHAKAVKAQRVARGLPIDDPDHYGEWIADVERPAEQYRGRYQLRLDDARDLLRRALPSGGGVEDVADVPSGSGPHAGPRAKAALAEARKYLGTPYLWGGSSPRTGFDCSGLVQWAYAKAGIQIPRVTDQQILAPGATKVRRDHLLPGDLVFFRDSSGYVHHVGMSIGGDRFIEAPRTGLDVRISSLKDPYYAEQFAGGRRFDPAVRPAASEARVMPALRPEDLD